MNQFAKFLDEDFSNEDRFAIPAKKDVFIRGVGYLSYFKFESLSRLKENYLNLIRESRKILPYADRRAYGQIIDYISDWEGIVEKIDWFRENCYCTEIGQ